MVFGRDRTKIDGSKYTFSPLRVALGVLLGYISLRTPIKSTKYFLFKSGKNWKKAWWLAHGFGRNLTELDGSKYTFSPRRVALGVLLGYKTLRTPIKSTKYFFIKSGKNWKKAWWLAYGFLSKLDWNRWFQIYF